MEWKFSEFSEFKESNKSLKHDLAQFEDPVFHMCLTAIMVASQSLTQEMAGLSPFTVMTNIFSVNSMKSMNPLKENSIGFSYWGRLSDIFMTSHIVCLTLNFLPQSANFKELTQVSLFS